MSGKDKSSIAYGEAINSLQETVAGFSSAQSSLRQASKSLGEIVKTHKDVAKALQGSEKTINQLVPDAFRAEVAARQIGIEQLLESVNVQAGNVAASTENAVRALQELGRSSEQQAERLELKLDSSVDQVISSFATESQQVMTRTSTELRQALRDLASQAEELSRDLKSQELRQVMENFANQVTAAGQQVTGSSADLSETSENFRLLLRESSESVESSLDAMTASQSTIPRWGYILFGLQFLIVLLIVIGWLV